MARPAQTISTSKLFEETHVDIEGDKFRLRQATRSVEEAHRKLIRELEAKEDDLKNQAEESEDDEGVVGQLLEVYGDMLDIWLEPLGEKKTHAKTLIKQAYKADKIGLAHLNALVYSIAEAGTERPT